MTERKGKWLSLRVRFAVTMIFAVAMGFLGAKGVKMLGDAAIERIYMEPERAVQRSQELMDSFEDYVTRNHLSLRNTKKITQWVQERHFVFLIASQNGKVLLNCGWLEGEEFYSAFEQGGEAQPEEPPAAQEPADYVMPGEAYRTIAFSNGRYQVKLYDFTEEPLSRLVLVLAYFLGTLLLLAIMIGYHQSVIRKICTLGREVQEVAMGNVHGNITLLSGDEIGDLSQSVGAMRDTVMEKMRAEQEAWNANSDLITRMSHDIRTPLTVLMGFLELLEEGQFSDDENYRSYLNTCMNNAYQLRELADRLFQYFFVFGHRSYEIKPEVVDAKTLLSQLVSEHTVLLREQGWQIVPTPMDRRVKVRVDPIYMKRLMDNLFSNIEKYADASKPVYITAKAEPEQIQLRLKNGIRPHPDPAQSTEIGLKTCERIVQIMGGSFFTLRDSESFEAVIHLPLWLQEDTGCGGE